MAAPTPRGYPVFDGLTAPAGPSQMQQLAEAIDADVQSVDAKFRREPVVTTFAIGSSGPVTSTSLLTAANSNVTWTPSQTGLAVARAEMDVSTVTAGYAFMLIELHVDGVQRAVTRFFEVQQRAYLVIDSEPFPVLATGTAGNKSILLKVAVYSGSPAACQINSGRWRVRV